MEAHSISPPTSYVPQQFRVQEGLCHASPAVLGKLGLCTHLSISIFILTTFAVLHDNTLSSNAPVFLSLLNSSPDVEGETLTYYTSRKNADISFRRGFDPSVSYVYVGDSRTSNLYHAHLRRLGIPRVSHYKNLTCANNTFRYNNADYCETQELGVIYNNITLLYRACWLAKQACFTKMQNQGSLRKYFQIETEGDLNLHVVMNIGLHDAIYHHKEEEKQFFVSSVENVMRALSSLNLKYVTWFGTFPLLPPQLGKSPKFHNWANHNLNMKWYESETALMATRHGFRVLNSTQFFDIADGRLSHDTVHLLDEVNDRLTLELIWLHADGTMQSVRSLLISEHSTLLNDTSCGVVRPSVNNNFTVGFYSGPGVFSDGNLVHAFENLARATLHLPVSTRGFEHVFLTSHSNVTETGKVPHAIRNMRVDIAVLEYCASYVDHPNESSPEVALRVQGSSTNHFPIYYCHRTPRNRFSAQTEHGSILLKQALKKGVMSVTNQFMFSSMLYSDERTYFTDEFHLTPEGGTAIAKHLMRSIEMCEKSNR